MELKTAILLSALLASGHSRAQSAAEAAEVGIEYPSPAIALQSLRDKPGASIKEENDWIVVVENGGMTIWSIASERHPAYPTAVKRALHERDGHVQLGMSILCGARKPVCDQVRAQFQAINQQLREEMMQRQEAHPSAQPPGQDRP